MFSELKKILQEPTVSAEKAYLAENAFLSFSPVAAAKEFGVGSEADGKNPASSLVEGSLQRGLRSTKV